MIHKTRDGIKMLISDMDDNHLHNTIKMICRKIEHSRNAMQNSKTPDFLSNLFIDDDEFDHEEICQKQTQDLMWYVLEASLRGMQITALLRKTFGREIIDF